MNAQPCSFQIFMSAKSFSASTSFSASLEKGMEAFDTNNLGDEFNVMEYPIWTRGVGDWL